MTGADTKDFFDPEDSVSRIYKKVGNVIDESNIIKYNI